MSDKRAKDIAAQFVSADGYTVTAQHGGILVQEDRGRTSFFLHEHNFFRFIETVAIRLHPAR